MNFDKLLFADIETVPCFPSFDLLDERGQQIYCKRFEREVLSQYPGLVVSDLTTEHFAQHYLKHAAFHAEWAKIVCVSLGYFKNDALGNRQVRLKNIASENESEILSELCKVLLVENRWNKIIAHNGKAFDFPFICRRLLINGFSIPDVINTMGKKNWEVSTLDTLELWKFGDFAHRVSLDLLTYVFGLPSPKINLNGADVYKVFFGLGEYAEMTIADRLNFISSYCMGDIKALVNIFCRMYKQPMVYENDFILTNSL